MQKFVDRPVMRQKINVSDSLLKKWKTNYMFELRQPIHKSLMKASDIGTKFEHEGRLFEIVGLGESDSIMLKEERSEGVFYWECTRRFTQMKLGRFNQMLSKSSLGTTIFSDIPYTELQLRLAPIKKSRRRVKEEETSNEDI